VTLRKLLFLESVSDLASFIGLHVLEELHTPQEFFILIPLLAILCIGFW
jgi:hypothetical protein